MENNKVNELISQLKYEIDYYCDNQDTGSSKIERILDELEAIDTKYIDRYSEKVIDSAYYVLDGGDRSPEDYR